MFRVRALRIGIPQWPGMRQLAQAAGVLTALLMIQANATEAGAFPLANGEATAVLLAGSGPILIHDHHHGKRRWRWRGWEWRGFGHYPWGRRHHKGRKGWCCRSDSDDEAGDADWDGDSGGTTEVAKSAPDSEIGGGTTSAATGNDPASAGQAAAKIIGDTVTGQSQQLAEKEIETRGPGRPSGAIYGSQQETFNSGMSVFTYSGVSELRHQGLTVISPEGKSRGPSFKSASKGLTAGVRLDASSLLGAPRNTVTFGTFGNLTTAHLTVNGDGETDEDEAGGGHVNTYAAGFYTLVNLGQFYLLGMADYSWGHLDFANSVTGAKSAFDTSGVLASAMAGTVMPLPGGLRADFRIGLTYAHSEAADYYDTHGFRYHDGSVDNLAASASAKLFATYASDGVVLRPFAQFGASQQFDYSNKVTVEAVPYDFDDARTSVFGRLGVDIEHSQAWQSYVAIRADVSPDSQVLAGQVGLTLKLD
jgi:hypothetical protein